MITLLALRVLGQEGAAEGEALVVGLQRAREVTGLQRGVADLPKADGDSPACVGALRVLVEECAGEGEAQAGAVAKGEARRSGEWPERRGPVSLLEVEGNHVHRELF